MKALESREGHNLSSNLASSNGKCCGCGCCAAVCPIGAIEMKEDEKGFVYPMTDTGACIGCNRCVSACSFKIRLSEEGMCSGSEIQRGFAVQSLLPNLNESASGGAFAAIAQSVLIKGGVIAGCEWSRCGNTLVPNHTIVNDRSSLRKLLGSKYVQSNTGEIFSGVRNELTRNHSVLFCGTPCQVDAINKFMEITGTNTRDLVTIDLICHGVPSVRMLVGWQKTMLTSNTQIDDIVFRDKSRGWGSYVMRMQQTEVDADSPEGRTKSFFIDSANCSYYDLFLHGAIFRDSCYLCPYANLERCSDITVGDYWGVDVVHPELVYGRGENIVLHDGVSCVLVNSKKGRAALQDAASFMKCKEVPVNDIALSNSQLKAPSYLPEERKEIIDVFMNEAYPGVERLWRRKTALRRLACKMKRIVMGAIGA